MSRHLFSVLLTVFLLGASGCGGERCAHDTCDPNIEFDSIVAVPDTGAGDTTGATDLSAGDATGDSAGRDAGEPSDVTGETGPDNGCPQYTPFLLDGKCVECIACGDCPDFGYCDPISNSCANVSCSGDTLYCTNICECHQCCEDADCLRYPYGTGTCLPDGTCEGVLPCQGLCTAEFPVCAVVQGMEQCVECATDADCGAAHPGKGCACVGDPLYSCVDSTGAICETDEGPQCGSTCRDASDCPPAKDGAVQGCTAADESGWGMCFDPRGTCDGTTTCCDAGMKCYDVVLVAASCMLGGTGTLVFDPSTYVSEIGYCECSDDGDCLSGVSCVEMSGLCAASDLPVDIVELVCPGGQLSPNFPERLCATLDDVAARLLTMVKE